MSIKGSSPSLGAAPPETTPRLAKTSRIVSGTSDRARNDLSASLGIRPIVDSAAARISASAILREQQQDFDLLVGIRRERAFGRLHPDVARDFAAFEEIEKGCGTAHGAARYSLKLAGVTRTVTTWPARAQRPRLFAVDRHRQRGGVTGGQHNRFFKFEGHPLAGLELARDAALAVDDRRDPAGTGRHDRHGDAVGRIRRGAGGNTGDSGRSG